jgi:NAD(P)H dehydrogenase (quinone)
MNILIITANPKPENHSKIIANTYKEVVEADKHSVRIVDIYAEENRLPFNTLSRDVNPVVEKMKEHITWAEEIVFVHPVWWGNGPAILKNWIDSLILPGFAYKYIEGKPNALLKGKTAKVFATAGSVAPYYTLPIVHEFTPLYLQWKYMVLGFCGIEMIDFKVVDKMNVNNSQPPVGHFEKYLEKVKKSAKNLH